MLSLNSGNAMKPHPIKCRTDFFFLRQLFFLLTGQFFSLFCSHY